MVAYQNILVIQTAFTGDVILATSMLEKLHAAFPAARISMLVRAGNETLFDDHPFLNEVLVWNKKQDKLLNLVRMMAAVRRRKFDCVVNAHRYTSSGFISAFSGARHIAGFKENPLSFLFNYTARHVIGDGRHEIDRLNELVADFLPGPAAHPRLYPSGADRKAISVYTNKPYVCMAPASVWFTKQLPADKWIGLCNGIDKSKSIFFIGAGSDTALCERIKNASAHPSITVLAGQLSLLQSCALIEGASMNYVNDSAPLHLASSVNAPVTAYFCSTVPAFGFGPLSTDKRVLGVEGLSCRPCGLHGYAACPLGHFRCGYEMPLS